MQNSYSSVNLTATGQDESSSEESPPPNVTSSPTKPSGEFIKISQNQNLIYSNISSTTSPPNTNSRPKKNHKYKYNAQFEKDGTCCWHDGNAMQR